MWLFACATVLETHFTTLIKMVPFQRVPLSYSYFLAKLSSLFNTPYCVLISLIFFRKPQKKFQKKMGSCYFWLAPLQKWVWPSTKISPTTRLLSVLPTSKPWLRKIELQFCISPTQVKLITCFHDSWIYEFFSRNFICFVFLQGKAGGHQIVWIVWSQRIIPCIVKIVLI